MPYKSESQRKYFHANKSELEKRGVNVSDWDKESKGKKRSAKAPVLREADFRSVQKKT